MAVKWATRAAWSSGCDNPVVRFAAALDSFILPGQWLGLPRGDNHPREEAVAVQIPAGEVERRSLEVYELVAGGVA